MTKTHFTVALRRDGRIIEETELDGFLPEVLEQKSVGLPNLAAIKNIKASACIYCSSTLQLSDEHVVPYALGGTLVIHYGSCEVCRKITSGFENVALNQGSMREIRRVSGFQSRSKNAKARSSIPVTLVRNGVESTEHVATEELPLMLGLPWFSLPGKLDDCDEGNLRLAGWVALSFGPALDTFLRARGATEMVFQEGKQQPVAFARMIAKIAYCHAWRDGVPELLEGTERLIEAFMEKPDELGQFVGTQDPPFRQFPELKLRMQYHFEPVSSLVHMEVQLFPDAATPTYLVVLGRCRTHRCWRRVRERLGNTALNNRRDRYKLAASEALARSGQTSSYLQSNIHELQQALPPATNADLAMQKRILQGE